MVQEWRPKELKAVGLARNLLTHDTVGKLQAALHAKAKGCPNFRFYALYDKIYRKDVLYQAYYRCRANHGAAGVDGVTFEKIDESGIGPWLEELTEALRKGTYQPEAVRRVWIPKPDGKQRPLGIPTIRDRVVQMAAVLVLEPIFEADLQPEQFAYRPNRSALEAVRAVHRLVSAGGTEVVDADLSGYFDTIPHTELLKSVARRISDRRLLSLIKRWLQMPVEETDERGRRRRTTRNKDEGKGTPQGAPISPLLSNLYMRRFVLGWKLAGHEARLGASIVNDADDFVICCHGTADQAMAAMRVMMSKLKLTVNETKTRLCRLPEESFDFLGYTIGRCYSKETGRSYLGTRPSKKKVRRLCDAIHACTERRYQLRPATEIVTKLNQMLRGWANYFRLGRVSPAYRALDQQACRRLRQWLCGKHKVQDGGRSRYPDQHLYQQLGLLRLSVQTRKLPWAKA